MAHLLFSNIPHDYEHEKNNAGVHQERLPAKIRLSIFLITGECVGLPALVWALSVLYRRYKTGGRISAFVVALLLCDLLVLLLNPYIVTELIQNENCWKKSLACWTFSSLWSGSLISGLHLQTVLVLEGALSVRHPLYFAHVLFPSCSVIISITVLSLFFLCELLSVDHLVLVSLPFLLTVTLTSGIVTCIVTPPHSDVTSRRTRTSCTVLAFVTFTVFVYLMFVIMCFVLRNCSNQHWNLNSCWDLWVMSLCLMSLRVIIDPLLCVLFYVKDLRAQTPPAHTEPNTETHSSDVKS